MLGVDLWVKRDDLTGTELTGNKVRKLEFLLADAIGHGADTVITCGGEQSNHCRTTALAATSVGLHSVLLLRTDDPANPPVTSGNILLDKLAGAEIIWLSAAEYARRTEIFEQEATRLTQRGRRPYVISEGGSDAVGTWGYIECARELSADLSPLPEASTSIIYACGSGGTGAGLIIGARMSGLIDRRVRVVGVNVCNDQSYFVSLIGKICAAFEQQYHMGVEVSSSDIDILDGYVGLGYAKSRPEELALLRDLARRDALILDPVYTGKAFYGLVTELAADPRRFGDRIVFVHTGGIFGLFPATDQIIPLL